MDQCRGPFRYELSSKNPFASPGSLRLAGPRVWARLVGTHTHSVLDVHNKAPAVIHKSGGPMYLNQVNSMSFKPGNQGRTARKTGSWFLMFAQRSRYQSLHGTVRLGGRINPRTDCGATGYRRGARPLRSEVSGRLSACLGFGDGRRRNLSD
jgi:hypothetical protein